MDPTRVEDEELRDLSDPRVRAAPLVVIVGAAGLGKSTTVERLCSDRDDVHYDLAEMTISEMAELRHGVSAGHEVFIDGFDSLADPHDWLEKLPVRLPRVASGDRSTRLRIVLRPFTLSQLRPELEKLKHRLSDDGQFIVLDLLPLTRSEARRFAKESSNIEDTNALFDAIATHNLGALAARPLTLKLLAEEWRQHGQLPSNESEILERSVERLLFPGTWSKSDDCLGHLKDATALGAASVLSARTNFSVERRKSDRQHFGPTELDELRIPHAEKVLKALTTIVPDGRTTTWIHRRYGEHLASAALRAALLRADAPPTTMGLRSLLISSVTSRVRPGLEDLATSLADVPAVFDLLVDVSPELMLRPGVRLPAERSAGSIANAILERVGRGEGVDLPPGLERHLDLLDPKTLEPVLKKWIEDRRDVPQARAMAARMVGHNRVLGLSDVVRDVALDGGEPVAMRAAAAFGFARLHRDVPVGHRPLDVLMPLVHVPVAEDEEQEILGIALKACWPVGFDRPFDVLPDLRRPRDAGAYRSFLQTDFLSRVVHGELLPGAIAWASAMASKRHVQRGSLRWILKELIRRAEGRMATGEVAVVEAVADAWMKEWELERTSLCTPETDDARRRLTEVILARASRGAISEFAKSGRMAVGPIVSWLRTDDLEWAIAAYKEAKSELLAALWESVVWNICSLERPNESPEAVSEKRARLRATHPELSKALVLPRQSKSHTQPEPSPVDSFVAMVETVENPGPKDWARWMRQIERQHGSGLDLTSLPEWAAMSEALRDCVVEGAARAIDPTSEDETRVRSDHGIWALALLNTRGSGSGLVIDWRRWAEAVLTTTTRRPAEAEAVARLLERASNDAPEEVAGGLKETLGRSGQAEDASDDAAVRALVNLDNLPTPAIPEAVTAALLTFLRSGRAWNRVRDPAFNLAARLAPGDARRIANEWLAEDDDYAWISAAKALLRLDANEFPRLWQLVLRNDTRAERFLVDVLRFDQDFSGPTGLLRGLDAPCLVELLEWTRDRRPRRPRGLRPADVADVEYMLARRLVDLDEPSVEDALAEMCKRDDTDLGYRRLLIEVRERRARREQWPTPKEVMAILEDPTRRVVFTPSELLIEVLDGLERLRDRLCLSPSKFWNEPNRLERVWIPRKEELVSADLAPMLADVMARNVVGPLCEVRPGPEQRVDLWLEAPGSRPRLRLVIEAKGSWHEDVVSTAAKASMQLKGYQDQTGRPPGILLGYWFPDPASREHKKNRVRGPKEFRERLEAQAEVARKLGYEQHVVILEFAYPVQPKPTSAA